MNDSESKCEGISRNMIFQIHATNINAELLARAGVGLMLMT